MFAAYPLASQIALVAVILLLTRKAYIRLQLSKAKHPSLKGHSKWSRRIARQIPMFSYSAEEFFSVDGASPKVTQKRQQGLTKLAKSLTEQMPNAADLSKQLSSSISDIAFTKNYRVPFPFSQQLDDIFKINSFATETKGTLIKDIDGTWRCDATGSYGVNVFGYDFYKECLAEATEIAGDLGPVLGPYHPIIEDNVNRLKAISGLDQISFHMSGTEAVMQAVRLARYHTGKKYLVRFCGAYHGWWDGVQPGIGNQRAVNDVYTLNDMSEQTLKVLSTRNDIACILINPLQAFHPNSDSASDTALIASDRQTNFDLNGYQAWLKKLRKVCDQRGIVLIFDEVFLGFRLGERGAQGYFDVAADIVTYGKTLGGGLPVGVVAGRADLMQRYKEKCPVNVSFARGTFNSHPLVMATMNTFLKRIKSPEIQALYSNAENCWGERVSYFNEQLNKHQLPIKITHMHSVLSVLYTKPSCYNWMLQFYLRKHHIELAWTGTGRLIMSLNFSDKAFRQLVAHFIAAATEMAEDGWWQAPTGLTNKDIKRQFLKRLVVAKWPLLTGLFGMPNPNSAGTVGESPVASIEKDLMGENRT